MRSLFWISQFALFAVACAKAPVAAPATTVRFADDAPSAEVEMRCGGRDAARSLDLATSAAYGDCIRAAGPISNAVAPFVGKTISCEHSERSPLADVDEKDFTAQVVYPGSGREAGLELRYSRTLANGSDRDAFSGPWAQRSAIGDRIVYHHDGEGPQTLGGYCESSTVLALVESLSVGPKTLVYREEWRCGALGGRSFREVRCALP